MVWPFTSHFFTTQAVHLADSGCWSQLLNTPEVMGNRSELQQDILIRSERFSITHVIENIRNTRYTNSDLKFLNVPAHTVTSVCLGSHDHVMFHILPLMSKVTDSICFPMRCNITSSCQCDLIQEPHSPNEGCCKLAPSFGPNFVLQVFTPLNGWG